MLICSMKCYHKHTKTVFESDVAGFTSSLTRDEDDGFHSFIISVLEQMRRINSFKILLIHVLRMKSEPSSCDFV